MTGVGPQAKVIAVWSALGIGAVSFWRVYNGRKSGTPKGGATQQVVGIVYSAIVLSLIVAVVADVNATLGAYFGALIILGLLPNRGFAGIFTGPFQRVGVGGTPPGRTPHQ